MISPSEIKQQALKWWKPFLQSHVAGHTFFPRAFDRIGRIKSSHVLEDFKTVQDQLEELYNQSKIRLGYGFVVKTAVTNFRRTGSHELPEAIVFESDVDYVKYIGRVKEWQTFLKNYVLVKKTLPQLENWIYANPEQLTVYEIDWIDILKVCQYFLANPRPELYIRQLPVEIHTKFIEHNEVLLRSLLDFLITDHIRDINKKSFAERYFLKFDEPKIRLRLLDSEMFVNELSDITIRLSDFIKLNVRCRNIILTENKMNFLALPALPLTMAIWSGGGFNIKYLDKIDWLESKNIFYWGDLDIQGFHILHQMKSYYPQTSSIMMNKGVFERFRDDVRKGVPGSMVNLSLLSKEEMELFLFLKEGNHRLEQEKINQKYAEEILKKIIV